MTEETPWRSIVIVSIFTFCTLVQFTLYFTSLWPYLQKIDSSVTEVFYGVIVATYSLGQIVFGPIVSLWATRTKKIVSPAQCCLIISLVGNVIYITASVLPSHQKWCVLVGRFLVGMSESSLSLYQTFASTASTYKDRSKALSITTGGVALGYSVGPALQLLFTPLGFPGYNIVGKLWVNMYTSPAIVSCIMNVVCIIVLRVLFVEKYAGLANHDTENSTEKKKVHVPKYDRLAVIICHLTRFVQLFVFTNLETIGTPFMMAIFALSSTATVKYLSIAHSIAGLAGFVFYMFHAFRKNEIIDFRKLLILSFGGFVLFHALTIPIPFTSKHLKTYSTADYNMYKNHSGIEPVGCPKDQFKWCNTTGTSNFWVFIVGIVFVMGVCWPNVNITLSTLLSKILGPRRQTHQQSIFQMSSSFARLIGPILISNVYTWVGPIYTWIFEITILIFIIIVWLIGYKRMVPLKTFDPNENVSKESVSDSEVSEESVSEDSLRF